MAFFHLTYLGAQNTIKSCLQRPQEDEERIDSIIDIKDARDNSEDRNKLKDDTLPRKLISYKEHQDRLRKHRRNEHGPSNEYRKIVTTSQTYGWNVLEDQTEEEWMKTSRHPHVNSEMTQFANDMSVSNREFTLF